MAATFALDVGLLDDVPVIPDAEPSADDPVGAWLSSAGHRHLLTSEQETDLASRAQAGCRESRDRLILSNLRLVVCYARRFAGRGLALQDLVQEGTIGLMAAVDRFDPRRGFRFSTYATWWIRQAMSRAVNGQTRAVRVPAYVRETIGRLMKTAGRMRQLLGRDPSELELSEAVGMPIEQVRNLLMSSEDVVSLDARVGESRESTLGDLLPDTDALDAFSRLSVDELWGQIVEAANLTEDEEAVLSLRIGLTDGQPVAASVVAKRLGFSTCRVRQIEARVWKRLRAPGSLEAIRALVTQHNAVA